MSILHDIPRECLHTEALRRVSQRLILAEAENARLREFSLRLAERIFLAHEVLGNLAERKGKR